VSSSSHFFQTPLVKIQRVFYSETFHVATAGQFMRHPILLRSCSDGVRLSRHLHLRNLQSLYTYHLTLCLHYPKTLDYSRLIGPVHSCIKTHADIHNSLEPKTTKHILYRTFSRHLPNLCRSDYHLLQASPVTHLYIYTHAFLPSPAFTASLSTTIRPKDSNST
jgi:hypothetical protein